MPDEKPQPGGDGQNPGGDKDKPAGGGGDAKAYLQYFPEALRSEKTLEKFSGKDVNEVLGKVATSYVNLEKHAGGMVKLPGEKSTPEERAAFNEKIGVPKDSAGYEIKEVKVGDKVLFNEADTATFLKWAHEQGFTKAQVKAQIDRLVQHEQARADTATQKTAEDAEQAYETIKKDWGSLTDRNVALVQRAVKEFGPEGFADWLDETGMGNQPGFLKFVFALALPMMEDGLIKGENLGMRRADAQAEIARLMSSKEYTSSNPAERLPVVEKIRELSAIAHAE